MASDWELTDLVEIEWVDAHAAAGWQTRELYESQGLCRCRSAGYLLKSTRKHVILVQTQSEDGKMTDSLAIPRSLIRRIRRLK